MEGRTLLVHAVGGGDCGHAAALDFSGRQPDYEGDPGAVGRDRRPLRKVFDGLTLAGEKVEGVALLGTTNEHRPGDRPFLAYAEEMAQRLSGPAGLCGRHMEPTCVLTLPVTQPTMEAAGDAVGQLLTKLTPAECLITCGSGSYVLSVGALMAAIEAGVPARLIHIDHAHHPYEIAAPRHGQHHLTTWLVRQRFWDELAQLDPDHRPVWELLAARQRADCAPARKLANALTGHSPSGLPLGKIAKLAELWPAVQAAFFERIGRGEAVDHALLRAWFGERLSRLYRRERPSLRTVLPRSTIESLEQLLAGSFEGGGASHFRNASLSLATGTTDSPVVRTLRDTKLMDMYSDATTHAAHLRPSRHRPLPYTVVEAADRFERDDVARELVARTGFTAWPMLGSGDVLVLTGVGLPRDGRDEDDRHALRTVLEHAHRRSGSLLRRGRIRLRLLASPETTERAHVLLAWTQPLLDGVNGEASVIPALPVAPDTIDDLRDQVLAHLRAGPPPTGLPGSGSLRDIDEILLVLSPGTAAANYGMIAAGIDWALEAACPFTITELARTHGGPPELHTGQSTLCRLGIDGVLVRLAASALRRLDLRTVTHLLSLGSPGLADTLRNAERFADEAMADPGHSASHEHRGRLAHARFGLVAHTLGDHPELAAYVAVESVRPALYTFEGWRQFTRTSPAARTLTRIRDASPYCHLLDRRRAQRGGRPRPKDDVRSLLRQLMAGLPDSRGQLVTDYERLLAELRALSPYTG
ncbi:hypothetical protein [Streptomyces marincola]|uniref:Uncharacterized protein n=1 Tax=Streptomyces marincola TaxID=2878388 RepID=A0A1W7D4C8_9ACTN|nr:hypothetical protein [Streptomyces marincola]ARQ71931.1 hypothetical protein CAG99_26620 [Streptomyces marincola]